MTEQKDERHEREEAAGRRWLDMSPADHESLAAATLVKGTSNSPGGLPGIHAAAQTHLLWAITKRLRLQGAPEHRG